MILFNFVQYMKYRMHIT